MASLHEFLKKSIFIRLMEDGFISTVRYGHLYAKSATWKTRCSEAADEALCLRRVSNRVSGNWSQQPVSDEYESDCEDR